jgi:hypothetical protein
MENIMLFERHTLLVKVDVGIGFHPAWSVIVGSDVGGPKI